MPSEQPFVSIIVPCYNQGHLLAEAVDSALGQTYHHREVIVVDDGSTDRTAAVAAGFGSRIRLVRQANRGLSAARNAGIRRSRGTVIGLLDADDRWLPEKLQIEVPQFADPRVGLVHGSYRKFPETHPKAGIVRKNPGAANGFHELIEFNWVGAPVCVLFRRSVYDMVGGFDERLSGIEDWDLWIRVATASRIVASAPVTAEYRLSGASMSRNYDRMYACLLRVIEKSRQHHPGCAICRVAVRKARRHARAYYCDLAARDAFAALAEGRRVRYLALRVRGICRNPRIARRILPAIARRVRSSLA
jgi:glycosyltransferase involved in cell wall biosynthesis